ncbi:ribosomal protein L11 methyltransferase [Sphingomonas vulcanisoli]|uniref:Ribosomal protein L11 methyltransferase n=1 Tax=Sphingomonas vulcanisoli TaxID=1658060 RepID=A0ABX0TUY1_9SPHN|nr:50S ribosomal protein L11 methyltransferase [Sphingomonas vulcanisoli]NIJ08838.1 ribosomal protein L11 methyltransferase [Sphingomonas vulcanisoli]
MSAEWQPQASESWKISFTCTKQEAEAITGEVPALEAFDPPPLLVANEPDPARPDDWRIEAYVEGPPSDALIATLKTLAPGGGEPVIERIEDADWVTISQAYLEPLRIGRFHVHTAAHSDGIPADAIRFQIEASRAFGTGHHETTTGCLEMLDRLEREGADFANIADIGAGTGLLAFASRALWPRAQILAADIDPISIAVTAENMAVNGIPADSITLAVADGVAAPAIADQAPFDLLIANILAGPLIALAPSFAAVIAPGATIILAGLLATQERAVLEAFAAYGLDIRARLQHGDWPILALRRAP